MHSNDTALQLDLFGDVLAAEQQHALADERRIRDALICLRDSVPEALEAVATLRPRHAGHDTRAPRYGGGWAYCVSLDGIRFESGDEWAAGGGWNRTPAHLLTWGELAAVVECDPRRGELAAWVDTLPDPRWHLMQRPFELWPNPGNWHIGYFCRDHLHERWSERRHAWHLLFDLLDDAIEHRGGSCR